MTMNKTPYLDAMDNFDNFMAPKICSCMTALTRTMHVSF